MKAAWLRRSGRPRVLVFFAGWGMDEAPFRRLEAREWDVLVYYDFRRLDEAPCSAEVESYPERALAAWSLGCAAANWVAQHRAWVLSCALAISGTIVPEDEQAGIPARWIEATAENLTEGGWAKFVRRMCPDAASRMAYDACPSRRDLPEAVEELQALRRLPPPGVCVFRAALVSDQDRILLPDNQRRCWARYGVPVRTIAAPHYPFHLWTAWEEVLAWPG